MTKRDRPPSSGGLAAGYGNRFHHQSLSFVMILYEYKNYGRFKALLFEQFLLKMELVANNDRPFDVLQSTEIEKLFK